MIVRVKAGSGRNVDVDVDRVGFFGKIFGLMFRSKKTRSLLLEFGREERWKIHSCFVFFDFLAVWLDSDDKIVGIRKMRPFEFCVGPEKKFRKLVEIPFNERNKEIINLLVGKRKV